MVNVKKLPAFLAMICFLAQQITCCCGSIHGIEGMVPTIGRNAAPGSTGAITRVKNDDHHCHDNESECHDHEAEFVSGSEKEGKSPCCPEGPHLCAATHQFAMTDVHRVVAEGKELCVWGNPTVAVPRCSIPAYSIELLSCRGSPLSEVSLDQLKVYLI